LGRHVKEIINTGSLIPDSKTIEIVSDYLKRSEYSHGYILDGFPRTIGQAKAFKASLTKVIYLHIDEKEALWRLSMRDDSAREDNTIQAVQKRIQQFEENTRPVLKHYEKKDILAVVDAQLTVEKVNEEILKSLGNEIIDHHLSKWKKKRKLSCASPLAGSGKASDDVCIKGLPRISLGDIVNEYVDLHKLGHTEDIHRKVRMQLREKHGLASLAIESKDKIDVMLQKSSIVIVSSTYTLEEYEYLKTAYPDADVYILAVYADKKVRYERASKRGYRPELYGPDRDMHELRDLWQGNLIAYADFLIK
jgi:adenylate kinase